MQARFDEQLEYSVRSATGAGMPTQLRPPSVVRTIDVHGCWSQGAEPSAQPSSVLTQVRSIARKPAGTGPPTGPTGADVGAALALPVGLGAGLLVCEVELPGCGVSELAGPWCRVACSSLPPTSAVETRNATSTAAAT